MPTLPPRALVRALLPYVSETLISPSVRSRLEAHTARLPAIFEWGIFECRFAPAVDRVDMLFRVSRPVAGANGTQLPEESTWPADHGLEPILPFFRTWLAANNELADVPLFWVEHDLATSGASPSPSPSPPFIQFCVDPGFPHASRALPIVPLRVRALAERGLAPLLGTAVDGAALDGLRRCAQRLPSKGRVLHVGVIPHRGSRDLRVLAAVPMESVLDWLAAIEWPGNRALAAEIHGWLGTHFEMASVQLDLGETVRPSLAMEFPLPSRDGNHPAWRAFMRILIDRGLASAEKSRAALDWMGDATHDLPETPWLVNLQRQLDVKVSLSADGELTAKAYLGFCPSFVLV
ncbi:hypothetical protein LZC95_05195 [Pendulispora brunnea]|uniref:Uncharacterized protein n=1 Tax=Pendulispora brunnea TaxID=2905690 RepID=A0ABZ2KGN7_9BACT